MACRVGGTVTIRGRRLVAGTALLGLVVLLAGWIMFFQPFHGSPSETSVTVTVPKGESVSAIGQRLEQAGVVDDGSLFALRVRLAGDAGKIHAGSFVLHLGMSYGDALAVLTGAEISKGRSLTIPEGLSRVEINRLAAKNGLVGSYLDASRASPLLKPGAYGAPAGASLEGFLFPSTYDLRLPPRSPELVTAQINAFLREFKTVDMSYAKSKNLTAFDVLTIAAMVERETAVSKERPLVAAVIWNRLHQHIPLGIDATTRYQYGNWLRPLRQSELASHSPWNTRNRQGLPPGPIGNPGIASIQAAARPAKTPFVYYVVKPWTCGEHTFAVTETAFNQAVAAYNRARQANGGQAPTKCH
ncbi:MAG: endolytic transglycosylase MltG [Actinobacteria bacterium]|nr:endolytic transglycosylase MltG [Actinomycetota bacterium]